MKKITALVSVLLASVLVFLVTFGIYSNVSAQNKVSNPPTTAKGMQIQMPSVSIDTVNIDKTVYKAGDEVVGSFSLTNHSTDLLENTSYRVLIGEKYQDDGNGFKMTGNFLDATNLFSLGDIKSGETKKVDFKYKVPSFLYGEKIAVQINAYTNNAIIIGSNSSEYINIEKSNELVSLTDVKLMLSNGREYNLSEGPTIYKDKDPKTASLSVKIKNESNDQITIYPKISTYNQQDRLTKINTEGYSIILKAGETRSASIELPNMDYKSGVYFSEVLLTDALTGGQLTSRIGARYIIGGDIATIHSVGVDKDNVRVGDAFKLSYVVTGMPSDISRATSTASKVLSKKEGQISVRIFNESKALVADNVKPFDLYGENNETVELLANENAKAMKAVISVYNGEGLPFLTKEVNLSGDFDKIAKNESEKKNFIAVVGMSIFILIVIVAYAMFRRKKINAVVMSIFVFISVLSVPVIAKAWIWTGTSFGCSIEPGTAPSVTISTPYDNRAFVEGSTFTLSGYVYFLACSNSGGQMTLNFSNGGGGESGNRLIYSQAATGGHYVWNESRFFMTRILSVGNRPGSYVVSFYLFDGCYAVYGYVPYTVQCASGRVPNASGYCGSPANQNTTGTNGNPSSGTNADGSDGGGSSSSGGGSSNTVVTYPSACGTQALSSVSEGSPVSTSGMCGIGNNLSGNVTFNYLNNEWRWTCNGTNGDPTAYCKTSCVAGTEFCLASNTCSKTCSDWCQNVEGAQTNRTKYIVDQDGLCYEPKFIKEYKLNPSISNSQGVCKAFWSTKNPLKNTDRLACKLNGTSVSCDNTAGVNIVPGISRFEVSLKFDDTVFTDYKDLKCTKNPNLIEF